jgi:predicted DNA-binding transcriptional regulator AlpA
MNYDNRDVLGLILIDAPEFMHKLGLRSQSRFYELAKQDPRFPKPIKRGRRFSRYLLTEADAYIRALVRERDSERASPAEE